MNALDWKTNFGQGFDLRRPFRSVVLTVVKRTPPDHQLETPNPKLETE
jgi:hypothetical protein